MVGMEKKTQESNSKLNYLDLGQKLPAQAELRRGDSTKFRGNCLLRFHLTGMLG